MPLAIRLWVNIFCYRPAEFFVSHTDTFQDCVFRTSVLVNVHWPRLCNAITIFKMS